MKKSENKGTNNNTIAECAFVAQQQLSQLIRPNQASEVSHSESKIPFDSETQYLQISLQSIVNTLLYPHASYSLSVEHLLSATAKSARVRQLYQYVLEQTAMYSSDSLIAASASQTLTRRQAKGFSIECDDDPDLPEQAHIILHIEPDTLNQHQSVLDKTAQENSSEALTKLIIHLGWQNAFYQLTFNHGFKENQGMAFQTIVNKTSAEYSAIVDVETRIYLTFLGT